MFKTEDLFGDDAELAEAAEEYEDHCMALFDLVSEHVEKEEIDALVAVHMLAEVTLRLRMVAYGIGVERPSAGGLKLDLDRFGQELDQLIRHTKKGADEFIASVKAAREAAEREEDDAP
jgi:hypothetical protein